MRQVARRRKEQDLRPEFEASTLFAEWLSCVIGCCEVAAEALLTRFLQMASTFFSVRGGEAKDNESAIVRPSSSDQQKCELLIARRILEQRRWSTQTSGYM